MFPLNTMEENQIYVVLSHTFVTISFLFLTSLLTFLLSGLVHLIKKTFCSLLTFLNVATRRG